MTREEAIDRLNSLILSYKIRIDYYVFDEDVEALSMGIEALENQKTAHWIRHENRNLGQCMKISYECSNCKVWLGCEYFVRKSYCPNCGAKMEGA